jgi:hypothetical protein
MSLSAREQRALDSIQEGLAGSDPQLIVLLATFTRLASGEEMPAREKIRAGSWRVAHYLRRTWRRSRQNAVCRHARQVYRRLGFQRAALLLWLLIAVTLVAIALAIGRGGGTVCTTPWSAVCGQQAPPHSTGLRLVR